MDKQSLEERIIIKEDTGCWIYMGKSGKGSKEIYYRTKRNNSRKGILLHRWVYENYIGPLPDNLDVRHMCNETHCVNPAHLLLGTHYDNMQDMVKAGRSHRPIGLRNPKAKLSEDQVRSIRLDVRVRKEIAADYGITPTNVHDIQHKHTWKHLAD